MGMPYHVSEVPEVEPRGDCIWVCWRGMEFYVPVPICQASMGRIQRALGEWHVSRAPVVPFRTDIAAE